MKAVFSGRCRCGHRFEEHHNARYFSAQYAATLPPGARPFVGGECKHYGGNEEGGLGPDLRVHCSNYVDRNDPDPPTARGTFTRRSRAAAWGRLFWQGFRYRVLRHDHEDVFRRERW